MLKLFLMRHAKSDWDADYSGDHERPLNKRGVKSAKRMGRFVSQQSDQPNLIVSSTSVRTKQTLGYFLEESGLSCPIRFEEKVYHANSSDIYEIISSCNPDVQNLMILGHEPTTSSMIASLTGGGYVRVTTASIACIEFGFADWSQVRAGTGVLQWFVGPRQIAD